MTLKNYFHLDYSSSLLTNSTLDYVHVNLTSELANYPLYFGKEVKVLVMYLMDLSIA